MKGHAISNLRLCTMRKQGFQPKTLSQILYLEVFLISDAKIFDLCSDISISGNLRGGIC